MKNPIKTIIILAILAILSGCSSIYIGGTASGGGVSGGGGVNIPVEKR